MALSKESGLTIKCSACGNQVEISKMGDHLCVGPMAELSPPPESKEQFDDGFSQPSYGTYGRTPPRVDTKAANRHFMDRGQLTPVSQPSESRNGSPIDDRPSQSPTKGYFSRSPTQAQQTGAYGGFGHRAARREPRESGSTKQGGGFFGRINAIAPGPFNNTSSRPPSERSAFPTRKESLEMWNGPSADDLARTVDRPGTSYSNLSGGSYTITIAPPKAARKNGYGGFGPPSTATNTLEPRSPGLPARSETYPKPSTAMEPLRRQGSSPGSRAERSPLHGQFDNGRQRSTGPDRTRKPPPRTSLLGQHTPRDSGSVDLAAEFGVSNPYHTPSDSASSGYSFSEASQSTAQTSPARSHTYLEKDMNHLRGSMEDLRTPDPAVQVSRRPPSPISESPYGISPRDMRFDPAVRPARLDQSRGYDQLLPSTAYDASAQRAPDSRYPDRRNDLYQDRSALPTAGRRAPEPARAGSREPVRSPSRGDCKACRLPIKGKSISSADGRLTGKYHKACFVCTTCSEPFTSTEFYVLGDKPYCEQHYHKLNGSLCGGCGRGIEGQYLEDEARIKYHVGCFRCLDCGRSLPDGYFEVDGNAYCERDAWKRTQQAPRLPSSGYGHAENDGGYESHQRAGSGSRPGYGGGAGGLPGRNPGRPGPGSIRGAVPSGKRSLPDASVRPRPKMNKRMTRLGRM
ncbi:hypothetical protein G6O67_004293 [Ophiocordyceps sinensis]|uniref:LIM zinc-binding domain-containing protein n=1 Tax=Ophiocordyceps sinensis TaxID=72228 RepID=A0A8H4PNX6_9HYPO|nr:hypothetical protein G6O67_004293 [Ophiocordyceps sinensis]